MSAPLRDFRRFASTYWRVTNKAGNEVRFVPLPSQRIMLHKLDEQRRAGKPGRLRVLKYRQAGSSLLWRLMLLHQVITRTGCTALSIAV